MDHIRVRFAPSPTGALHIGGARTALFNWLFARKYGGRLVLRLEDSDASRSDQASAQGIIEGLNWLGLDWDEGPQIGGEYGPYRQSERLDIYHKCLDQLLAQNKAYYCFCSAEQLAEERDTARRNKIDYKYPGHCSNISISEAEERIRKGEPAVIRFRSPENGVVVVPDLIRGEVEFSNQLLDDFILAKSDGWPTYNFAVVADDHYMLISHVIRAEEHLSNTPKQILLYRALGWEIPHFAHVSMILAPDRSKLSKRHGATSVQEFRGQGYLPEALINYLALLGWSSGADRDFWTVEDLRESFDLAGVSRSPAIYDMEKLSWMNGHYLAEASSERIANLLHDDAVKRGFISDADPGKLLKVVSLLKGRVKTVQAILDEGAYFFRPISAYDEKGCQKYFLPKDSLVLLKEALIIYRKSSFESIEGLELELRQRAEELNIKAAKLIHPLRLALSGRTNTPGIFELMEVLGKDECIQRISNAILYVENLSK